MRRTIICLLALAATPAGAFAQLSPVFSTADSSAARIQANLRLLLNGALRRNIVQAAEAMPADKYGFAPTIGEFAGVRTFGRQILHLAATNYILAAAALGQAPPAHAGDEAGPDSVVTKVQHVAYLIASFDAVER